MPNLWQSVFRNRQASDGEKRMTVDDWMAQYFTYQGLGYPISYHGSYSDREAIANDFVGYVNGIYKSNGIVFACMVARQNVFSEARFLFQPFRNGRPQDLVSTKELAILERPWPGGTTGDLLARAIQDVDLAGNCFVVREGTRLRRLRPDWVEIILTAPPEDAVQSDVAGYLYKPGGTQDKGKWKLYPIGQDSGTAIAHWAPIPDPEAQYRGMSWLTPVIREIMADKAATQHKAKFFDNAATPSLAVSFKETVTKEQFKEFIEAMDNTHKGVENAYETLYLGGGADVTVVGADLKQMDFKATQGAGEVRIAAAARIHPVIVGISEGLQGSSLNEGNFRAAKDGFADSTLRPLWRSFCAAFEAVVKLPGGDTRLWYDDRDIPFLRADRTELTDILQKEAAIIADLIMQGFTPKTVVEAVKREGDWSVLEHTGLYSVQLQPPGDFNNDLKPDNIDQDGDGKPDVSPGQQPTPTPTGGPRPTPGTGKPPPATVKPKNAAGRPAKKAAPKGQPPKKG